VKLAGPVRPLPKSNPTHFDCILVCYWWWSWFPRRPMRSLCSSNFSLAYGRRVQVSDKLARLLEILIFWHERNGMHSSDDLHLWEIRPAPRPWQSLMPIGDLQFSANNQMWVSILHGRIHPVLHDACGLINTALESGDCASDKLCALRNNNTN
jgi:hypothetical protein